MFTRSAASDTLQGKAIQAVNEKWGEDFLNRAGRETIGIPVCKKKYNPFLFHVVEVSPSPSAGTEATLEAVKSATQPQLKRVAVLVERMYGCKCHHSKRKKKIILHGVRDGWQPYGVWSLKKALEVAKQEEARLNREISETGEYHVPDEVEDDDTDTIDSSLAENSASVVATVSGDRDEIAYGGANNLKTIRTISLPGNFTWRIKSAYDNIFQEIHGYSESDAEDADNGSKLKSEEVAKKKACNGDFRSQDHFCMHTADNSVSNEVRNLETVASVVSENDARKVARSSKATRS